MADDPIFIFGAPRSGTSLLSRILNAHPDIGIPYETMLYRQIYPWRRYYGDLTKQPNRERLVDDVLASWWVHFWNPVPDRDRVLANYDRHDFHGVLEALMRAWLETQGKRRWGEKSPHHTFEWRVIADAFPTARVIHLIRDGRDVAVSWKKAPFGPRDYDTLARQWVAYIDAGAACRQALDPERFLEVRYEDLLKDTESVTRRIADFLSTTYHPDMVAFHEKQSDYPTDPRNRGNLLRPVISHNAGKWKTEMSATELRHFEAVAGPTLERSGYDKALENARLTPLESTITRKVTGPLHHAYGKLTHRRAHLAALNLLRIRMRAILWSARQR